MEKSYLLVFFKEKIINAVILGTLIGMVILISLGDKIFVNYIAGFLTGVLNLVFLTIGCEIIISFKPLVARIAHFVFFALRYIVIALFIVYYYLHKDANIFAVIGGLLVMHTSIFVFEMKKHLFSGKEG
jgi:hypothetical protein